MSFARRLFIPVAALLVSASALSAQERQDPIPGGLYTFVPEESERIEDKLDDAVDHMNFLIRGIAKGRLRGANEPIDRIDLRYKADTIWVSLRADEPWVVSLRDGEPMAYQRADGEVVQVTTEVEPGTIDQNFQAEDGRKQMIYTLRDDGLLEVESIVYSDKLEEPFRYTWVYKRIPRPETEAGAAGGDDAP